MALLVGLSPAVMPMRAWAQAPSDDATTTMARARFKEGVEFYDKGEFEQARASFLQAYALKKHPAVLLNLAWSCLKSGHALEAEKYFKQFLAEGKDITDKQRADANDGLTQSRAKLGRIEVSASAGAEVTVDGERVGVAPLSEPVSVEAGAHTVKFKAPDGTTETQSVSVLGGEKAVARFKVVASTTAPAPAPVPEVKPPPEPEKVPPPPPKPPEEVVPKPEPNRVKETPAEAGGGGPLAPPSNLVPVIVFGTIAVAGAVTAGVMLAYKNQAQSNLDTVATEVKNNVPGRNPCNNPPVPSPGQFNAVQACSDYVTDINQVNQDATAGNIALGVAIAGAAGAVVYWLVANKGPASNRGAITQPVLVPILGRSEGGLSLTASF
jgi:hypothetical protein